MLHVLTCFPCFSSFLPSCLSLLSFFPVCVTCPELSHPENGQVMWTGLTPGSTATYTCDVGFELNGAQTRTCQSDGTWSDDPPTCDRKYLCSNTALNKFLEKLSIVGIQY